MSCHTMKHEQIEIVNTGIELTEENTEKQKNSCDTEFLIDS